MNDKGIKWVAQFHAKDEEENKIIKIGIKEEFGINRYRPFIFIYFDFDLNNSDGVSDSEKEAMEQINERWGYMDTFQWIM